jgi:serpin B
MIPEFKIEDKTELTDILNDLGMKKMFSLDAEFLPMASYNKESLYCSAVVQKVYLELDRHGTKAAAVTWGEMDTKSAMPVEPKKVYLDRPFVYMIVDAKYGLPLFVGSVEEL